MGISRGVCAIPFNGSGTFTIVNTFVPNTTILSSAVNANFTDIATGLSDCLTRDNQAGMTGVFRAVSGSVSAPGITFNSDTTSGLYLSATGIPGFVAHSLGMLLNTTNYVATSATVSAGGSGYAVGDTITATGGTAVVQPVFQVATLSGSAVATVTVAFPGSYSAKPSNPVAQGSTSGSGTGCTLTVTYNDPTSSDYRAIFTDQAAAVIWPKLGASSFMSTLMSKATAYDVLKVLAQAGTGITFDSTTSPATISAPSVPYQGGFKNLSIKVATNTTVAVAADAVIVSNGSGLYLNVAPASTINLGTNGGVNALDTGTIAIDTWYFIWVVAKSDGTTACLASTSSTAPTMPSGYTYKARIGAVKTIHGSATLYGTWQLGRDVQYVVGLAQTSTSVLATSGTTSSAWTAFTVNGGNVQQSFVPSTAGRIRGHIWANSGTISIAPNQNYGIFSSTTNAPLVTANSEYSRQFDMLLESSAISWWSSVSTAYLFIDGWQDNI